MQRAWRMCSRSCCENHKKSLSQCQCFRSVSHSCDETNQLNNNNRMYQPVSADQSLRGPQVWNKGSWPTEISFCPVSEKRSELIVKSSCGGCSEIMQKMIQIFAVCFWSSITLKNHNPPPTLPVKPQCSAGCSTALCRLLGLRFAGWFVSLLSMSAGHSKQGV